MKKNKAKKLVFSRIEKVRFFSESELRNLLVREIKENKKFLEERCKKKNIEKSLITNGNQNDSSSLNKVDYSKQQNSIKKESNIIEEIGFKSIKISNQKFSINPITTKEELYKLKINAKKLSLSRPNLKIIKSNR